MEASPRNLDTAISEWTSILGPDRVLADTEAVGAYGLSTMGVSRIIPAVLRPSTVQEVVQVLQVARLHSVPLYPISTGHNWGYGTANPAIDGCVVVDLSLMNRILDMDDELGVVTVEPGVTQQQLRDFLDEKGLAFLVPVHGGGPTCSLLGNALERGYGITPFADHFGAVMALEAVLPDGRIYRSPFSELGGSTVDRVFKWGMGPYLDGIFSQSNFGIVTRVTIALAPAPEAVCAFFFALDQDEKLEEAILRIRQTLTSVGSVAGSLNLMNARRVLSMMVPYPDTSVPGGGVMPDELVTEMCRAHYVMPWTGTGALYGNKGVVRAARSVIRQKLGPVVRRLTFVTPRSLAIARRATALFPGRGKRLVRMVEMLGKTMDILSGRPSQIALPLAYWKSGISSQNSNFLDPARDGCGLIWYSPLVPMKPESVRTYVDMVKGICLRYEMEPLITLTSLSNRCFDSTVPLLFDRENPDQAGRARDCYRALFEAGREHGFLPYRANIDSMALFVNPDSTFWQMASRLKRAVDPENLIAPGRYVP